VTNFDGVKVENRAQTSLLLATNAVRELKISQFPVDNKFV